MNRIKVDKQVNLFLEAPFRSDNEAVVTGLMDRDRHSCQWPCQYQIFHGKFKKRFHLRRNILISHLMSGTLQFLPHSPYSQSSLRFVKWFDIKFQVQRHILRANHEDLHYAAAQNRYFREFCVKFRDYCTFLSVDYKHSISVGVPDAAVATLHSSFRVFTAAGTDEFALDHHFTKAKLTPLLVKLQIRSQNCFSEVKCL